VNIYLPNIHFRVLKIKRGKSYIDKGKRVWNRVKLEYVNTVEIRRLKKIKEIVLCQP
jgi:hypothetical protein